MAGELAGKVIDRMKPFVKLSKAIQRTRAGLKDSPATPNRVLYFLGPPRRQDRAG